VLVAVVAGALMLAGAARPTSSSATYTVASTLDEPAADPASPDCDSTPSHVCTLRAAIDAARNSPGPATIDVPAGTYTLTLGELVVGGGTNLDTTIFGLAGDPADVSIVQSGSDRVLETAADPALHVTLDGLTLRGGQSADDGGGLLAGAGTTTIVGSVISGNSSSGSGGGIAAIGDVAIAGSVVGSNQAAGPGGGLAVENSTASVETSSFVANSAGAGGAVSVDGGTAVVATSRLVGNAARSPQGAEAAVAAGSATLDDDWWGSNEGPASADLVNAATTEWLQLRVLADPDPVPAGQSAALTADLLGRNTGPPLDQSSLVGLPAFAPPDPPVFGDPELGTLSSVATEFVDGRATASFDAGATSGDGSVEATADDQTVTAPVTVGAQPVVTEEPASQTVCEGAAAQFEAAASATPVATVQWQISSDNGSTWGDVAGATSDEVAFTAQQGESGNRYRAVFTNVEGTAPSDPAVLTVLPAPTVRTDPLTQTVAAGQTASFTVAALDATGLQWQVSTDDGGSWSDLSGETGPRLTLTAQSADDGYRYRAATTNGCGTAYTQPATLFVASAPGPEVHLPAGFAETRIGTGFKDPTTVAIAPDGRIFIVEQGGTIRIIENGSLLPTPFLTLTNIDEQGERGLESIAFDPNFATNHYVYVFYAAATPTIHNRVSRFTANGDVADPLSEVDLLDIEPATSTYHNGGMLAFGPDGDLYIATGDNLTATNAQDFSNLKGKILRIRPDGSIPPDNPFLGQTTGPRQAIWALGLRNPYTFAFQPGTGRLFIDDVGLHTWEEIDEGAAGSNYGWPIHEGPSSDPPYVSPLYAYLHGDGPDQGCAIIGAGFYNPSVANFPARYVGRFFFADYCNGWIHTLDPGAHNAVTDFATNGVRITGLTVDQATGDLYYLSRPDFHGPSGDLYRVSYVGDDVPRIDIQPQDLTLAEGDDATFSVVPTGGEPFSYQWQRNGVDIPGATGTSYTLPSVQPADDGATIDVVVSNTDGSVTSRAATLHVTSDEPPVVTITKPGPTKIYRAGDVISFQGKAVDPEDGTEPARRFTWTVTFHHRDHEHPFMPPTSGITRGTFTVPVSSFETDYDVYFHIILTVTDSAGISTTVTRDVHPKLATVKVLTDPGGLTAELDGTPMPTPLTFIGVVNFERSIGAGSPQTLNGRSWAFDSWSDGGAQTHTIATPPTATAYTAVFHVAGGSVGTGTGLTGAYYDSSDFTGPTTTRVDPTIAFQWRSGQAPVPGVTPPTYSVRWTGQLQAQFSERYTFSLRSDDGARLILDGTTLIDDMTAHTARTDKASVKLVAGTRHTIEVDYANVTGAGLARLSWQSASTPLSLVPSSQLYP
jgi:glucose/arabinose dehydrogenase